jgi:hypothetical protein
VAAGLFYLLIAILVFIFIFAFEFYSKLVDMRDENKDIMTKLNMRLLAIRTQTMEDKNKLNECMDVYSSGLYVGPVRYLKKWDYEFRSLFAGNRETMSALEDCIQAVREESKCPINYKLSHQNVLTTRLVALSSEVSALESNYSRLHQRVRHHYNSLVGHRWV